MIAGSESCSYTATVIKVNEFQYMNCIISTVRAKQYNVRCLLRNMLASYKKTTLYRLKLAHVQQLKITVI